MKRLKKYKELVKAAWRALNEKDLPAYEKKKDVKAFNKFFDHCVNFLYVLFGIFSLISFTLFATRVIF